MTDIVDKYKQNYVTPFILPELGRGRLRKVFGACVAAVLALPISVISASAMANISFKSPQPAAVEQSDFNWHLRCSVPESTSEEPFLFSTINFSSPFSVPTDNQLSPYNGNITKPVLKKQAYVIDETGESPRQLKDICAFSFNGLSQWVEAESVLYAGTREQILPHPSVVDLDDLENTTLDKQFFTPSLEFGGFSF